MNAIDWTKPLEHVDGTPLVLYRDRQGPDIDGDYYVAREDGLRFTDAQDGLGGERLLIVRPDGLAWRADDSTGPLCVRNRTPANEIIRALLEHAVHDEARNDECIAAVAAARAYIGGA